MSYDEPATPPALAIPPKLLSWFKRPTFLVLAAAVFICLLVASVIVYRMYTDKHNHRQILKVGGSVVVPEGQKIVSALDKSSQSLSIMYNPATYPALETDLSTMLPGQLPTTLLSGKSGFIVVSHVKEGAVKMSDTETTHTTIGFADEKIKKYQFDTGSFKGVSIKTDDRLFLYRISPINTVLFMGAYQNQSDIDAFLTTVSSYKE